MNRQNTQQIRRLCITPGSVPERSGCTALLPILMAIILCSYLLPTFAGAQVVTRDRVRNAIEMYNKWLNRTGLSRVLTIDDLPDVDEDSEVGPVPTDNEVPTPRTFRLPLRLNTSDPEVNRALQMDPNFEKESWKTVRGVFLEAHGIRLGERLLLKFANLMDIPPDDAVITVGCPITITCERGKLKQRYRACLHGLPMETSPDLYLRIRDKAEKIKPNPYTVQFTDLVNKEILERFTQHYFRNRGTPTFHEGNTKNRVHFTVKDLHDVLTDQPQWKVELTGYIFVFRDENIIRCIFDGKYRIAPSDNPLDLESSEFAGKFKEYCRSFVRGLETSLEDGGSHQ